MTRERSLDLLAPVALIQFRKLADVLRRTTPLLVFETYRDPVEQELVFQEGRSKARAFQSAHQFGLAVDFVPFTDGKWHWPDVNDGVWDTLRVEATKLGLRNTIEWDRPHVEHPAFASVRRALR